MSTADESIIMSPIDISIYTGFIKIPSTLLYFISKLMYENKFRSTANEGFCVDSTRGGSSGLWYPRGTNKHSLFTRTIIYYITVPVATILYTRSADFKGQINPTFYSEEEY